MTTDTIAAIATGMSNAGISIIRISGDDALSLIDKMYRSKKAGKVLSKEDSHTIHYGYIVDGDEIIDEVMVAVMKAPGTYTREDVVEINCHGGIVVTRKVIELVLRNGARIAEPGEFTKRAFLNGRIDLSQAEAISDLIQAKNELALKNSLNQLRGGEKEIITKLRDSILYDIAYIEAALDDPEHMSLEGFDDKLINNISKEEEIIAKLIKESRNGKIIKEGIKTVIVGKPNAGKSSLLNWLVGEERAIVTDIAGTTRDTLEETINLSGITLNVIDTAGIRKTHDIIEKIGVDKAVRIVTDADLIVFVIDSSTSLDENDEEIFTMIENKKAIILLNKLDLAQKVSLGEIHARSNKAVIQISIKDSSGLEKIEQQIKDMFFSGEITLNEDIYITNERHKDELERAFQSLKLVKQSVRDGMPEDFYTIDLMNAYESLGRILGENVEEDLVNKIFKEFCMGK
ncbi:MAG TPA: tRNA uridine-5-carboxymethylaminomethyl(34) synthesis GTPase MnmE [Clostridiales bacterium]|nr:tRNA uridine-5-carboxymethylaminomethyl(34) synthesis GTPase MnmE [Clostridiales bacterium]